MVEKKKKRPIDYPADHMEVEISDHKGEEVTPSEEEINLNEDAGGKILFTQPYTQPSIQLYRVFVYFKKEFHMADKEAFEHVLRILELGKKSID